MEKGQVNLTKRDEETRILGEEFSKKTRVGQVISLIGDLGSGKTTFSQGFARGLSISKRIISPTFVLLRHYEGKKNGKKMMLYHVDLYRLDKYDQVRNIGIEEIFEDKNGIVLIEWANKHPAIKSDWDISFEIRGKNREILIKRNE